MNRGNDICLQLTRLCGDLSGMQAEIDTASEAAAEAAAKVIQQEQERVFKKAHFKRTKKRHRYQNANEGLITISKRKLNSSRFRLAVGFDTPTLKAYPELVMIEFGRPGKSPGRSKNTDKLGRKKGKFPEEAVVMPIRMGFQIAKDEAFGKYDEQLTREVKSAWNNSSR